MGYVVAVKRAIGKREVVELASADSSLRVTREDNETLDLTWLDGMSDGFFQLVKGEIQATSPSAAAMAKLSSIAKSLGAEVVGEEDLVAPPVLRGDAGVFSGRSTWVGWPVLVVVLSALLVWRW